LIINKLGGRKQVAICSKASVAFFYAKMTLLAKKGYYDHQHPTTRKNCFLSIDIIRNNN